MLICNQCGRTIDERDLTTHKYFMAYRGDAKYYETNIDNCACGGNFEEAVKCDCCEDYSVYDDIINGWRYNIRVCKGCIDHYKYKYSSIYNRLTLNGEDDFVDWLIDKGEIQEK